MDFIGTDDPLAMAMYGLLLFGPLAAVLLVAVYLVLILRGAFKNRK